MTRNLRNGSATAPGGLGGRQASPSPPRVATITRMSATTVGILGYGRFGAALAELLSESGHQIRALDPHSPVPPGRAASSLASLVDGARFVFVAVPVTATTDALRALRPLLTPQHVVCDVASVKVGPEEAMASILGNDVPWVATHPLFGPSSIALGERPLRVVVCPNPRHPTATDQARALYQSLQCEVLEQDASTHDRVMADTHALAFFVAKGLMDMGASEDLPFAPPSFQAMARTIEAVRSDAGHLFFTIQRDNGFAADARRRLLDALTQVHDQVEAWEGPVTEDTREFRIPSLGPQAPELRETRDLIDECDEQLVGLLARRAQLSKRAGRVKARHGRPVRDPARENELLAARRVWADQLGLNADAVAEIFHAIMRGSRAVQQE